MAEEKIWSFIKRDIYILNWLKESIIKWTCLVEINIKLLFFRLCPAGIPTLYNKHYMEAHVFTSKLILLQLKMILHSRWQQERDQQLMCCMSHQLWGCYDQVCPSLPPPQPCRLCSWGTSAVSSEEHHPEVPFTSQSWSQFTVLCVWTMHMAECKTETYSWKKLFLLCSCYFQFFPTTAWMQRQWSPSARFCPRCPNSPPSGSRLLSQSTVFYKILVLKSLTCEASALVFNSVVSKETCKTVVEKLSEALLHATTVQCLKWATHTHTILS